MTKRLLTSLLLLVAILPLKTTSAAADDFSSFSMKNLQGEKDCFVPLDTAPQLSDFHLVLQLQASHFSTWIFPILTSDSFLKINPTIALSDHCITWEEIALFFTSIGQWDSLQKFLPHDLVDHFTEQVISHLDEEEGAYRAKEDVATRPAQLPLAIFQCYANWRTVRYWLYEQLHAQEATYEKGLGFIETPSELTTYFRKQGLLPIIDPLHGINHLAGILAQSLSVGSYWFSQDGNIIDHINAESPYRLTTLEEMATWPINDVDPNKMADAEQEGYCRLAINILEMEGQPGFNKQEKLLQEAQAGQYVRLQASNQQKAIGLNQTIETANASLGPLMETLGEIGIAGGVLLLGLGASAACGFDCIPTLFPQAMDRTIGRSLITSPEASFERIKSAGFDSNTAETMETVFLNSERSTEKIDITMSRLRTKNFDLVNRSLSERYRDSFHSWQYEQSLKALERSVKSRERLSSGLMLGMGSSFMYYLGSLLETAY